MAYLASVLVKKDHTTKGFVISTVSLLKRGRGQQSGHMDKWKLNLNWIMVLFVILILTLGCKQTQPIKPKFHGDYPVEMLRSMWAFCVQNFRLKAPQTPPFLVGQMCDCYLDEMRKEYSSGKVNKLPDNESKAMGQKLIRVCNVNQSPIQKI